MHIHHDHLQARLDSDEVITVEHFYVCGNHVHFCAMVQCELVT